MLQNCLYIFFLLQTVLLFYFSLFVFLSFLFNSFGSCFCAVTDKSILILILLIYCFYFCTLHSLISSPFLLFIFIIPHQLVGCQYNIPIILSMVYCDYFFYFNFDLNHHLLNTSCSILIIVIISLY